MMSAKEDSETLRIDTLRERIFFAARDGLAITLFALLSELNPQQQSELLSQVNVYIYIPFTVILCNKLGLIQCWGLFDKMVRLGSLKQHLDTVAHKELKQFWCAYASV